TGGLPPDCHFCAPLAAGAREDRRRGQRHWAVPDILLARVGPAAPRLALNADDGVNMEPKSAATAGRAGATAPPHLRRKRAAGHGVRGRHSMNPQDLEAAIDELRAL